MLTRLLLSRPIIRILMRIHIFVYRYSKGRLLGSVQGRPVVLLTTTGRKTGRLHTVPLGAVEDGDNYAVVASNGGRDRHPAWFLNIVSDPGAIIEVGDRTIDVSAILTQGSESKRLGLQFPWLKRYKERTERQIPVILLKSVT